MKTLQVKNWQNFQHYKDRNPTWIKLHKNLLDDYEFQCLPLASRALAPMLWLLASEDIDGSLNYDITKISFRLRMTESDLREAIKPLLDKGFFNIKDDASNVLAICYQDSSPEKETYSKEKENIKAYKKGNRKMLLQDWETANGVLDMEKLNSWITNLSLDTLKVSAELEVFKLKCKAKGYQYIDFVSAFQSWVNNKTYGNGIAKFKTTNRETA